MSNILAGSRQSQCHRHKEQIKFKKKNCFSFDSTFDFSTLYTNIAHHKLKSLMRELIKFCFNGDVKEFIGITRYGAIWITSWEKYELSFNKTSLKLAISYLIDNSCFTLDSMCFHQLIEIRMGSDPASFMVNLFLYYSERKCLLQTIKQELQSTRIFQNIFRFTDKRW